MSDVSLSHFFCYRLLRRRYGRRRSLCFFAGSSVVALTTSVVLMRGIYFLSLLFTTSLWMESHFKSSGVVVSSRVVREVVDVFVGSGCLRICIDVVVQVFDGSSVFPMGDQRMESIRRVRNLRTSVIFWSTTYTILWRGSKSFRPKAYDQCVILE